MRIAVTKFLKSSPRGVMTYIEFAFVAPLLFLLIFGIINFSQLLLAYNFVSYSSQEAARWASVRGSQSKSPEVSATVATIQGFVSGEAIGLIPANLITNATWQKCSTCINSNDPGSTVTVQVQYTYNWIMPIIHPSAKTLSSTSVMVISQ